MEVRTSQDLALETVLLLHWPDLASDKLGLLNLLLGTFCGFLFKMTFPVYAVCQLGCFSKRGKLI